MKLTNNQIQQLYTFTRDHFVYHFDLQTELVDHLANGIERKQEKNQNLSFEDALQIEFKKFGIFGFQDVVEKRKKALNKKYWKITLRFYKEFFSLPKILLTFSLTALLFIILKNFTVDIKNNIIVGLYLILLIPAIIKSIKYRRILKTRQRKWMLEEMLLTQTNLFGILYIQIHLFNFQFNNENIYLLGIRSFIVIATLLLFYVMVFEIPKKAERLLEETYPEYKMMNTL